MRETPKTDYGALLRTLVTHDVEFIVVGAVGAVLQGAPVNTFDLDVVHSRTARNIDRALTALASVDAFCRDAPERRLRPDRSRLSSPGHQLLATQYGPLDLLGTIGRERSYEDLLEHVVEMEIAPDLCVRVLELATLIEVKEETATEKDRATLPILRRTLDERRRKSTEQ